MTMPKKGDPPRRPRLPAEHCSRDFQRYQYSLGSPRVIADMQSRLGGIERRLDNLSNGLRELQRTIVSQERRRAISTSNLLSYYGRDFIEACYVHLLGRFPEPEVLPTYEAHMATGASRRSILLGIYQSKEARSLGVHVRGVHLISFWNAVSRLARRTSFWAGRQKGKKILHAEQLLAVGGTDFLVRCYGDILGREPDPDGLEHYSTELAHGTPRLLIIANLAYSKEAKLRDVSVRGLWWRYPLARLFRGNSRTSLAA